ncbi:MAG: HAD family hydrolase [Verrucomicrobiales bacterium]|nr:HAD family hydrolase [Verrucomicrobiales bacterium]
MEPAEEGRSMNPDKAVIFDLDGTLLDTLRDLADSGNAVLEARGFPGHPTDAYRTFIGNGMMNLVRDIFPEGHRPALGGETDAVLAEYRAAYAGKWQNTTVIFPGVASLLDGLTKKQIPIGVLSNKAHDFTEKCVDAFLGDWKWDVVLGAREGIPKKPDPAGAVEAAGILGLDPDACYFIGDSDVDMMTAVNAGMRAIGVSWGFRPVEELKEAGAERILDQPGELLELLLSRS